MTRYLYEKSRATTEKIIADLEKRGPFEPETRLLKENLERPPLSLIAEDGGRPLPPPLNVLLNAELTPAPPSTPEDP